MIIKYLIKIYRAIIYVNNYIFYFHKFGKVGLGTMIMNPARIIGGNRIFIGKNCLILDGARLECIETYANNEYNGKIQIYDNVSIGQGVHIVASNMLVIEKNATLSSYVFISDCHHNYEDIEANIMSQLLDVRKVHIGEGCLIGRGVAILAGASVGKHSVIGANSVVIGKIPDYSVACGIPAKVIKKYDFDLKKWVKC